MTSEPTAPPAEGDPRPASAQVAEAIKDDIVAGRLAPGGRVPSVRDLAERYGVAMVTAQKAVTALKADGVVYTSRGRGTYVRSDALTVLRARAETASGRAVMDSLDELRRALAAIAARVDDLERAITNRPARTGH